MKLDSRQFSKAAHDALVALRDGDQNPRFKNKLEKKHHGKASSLIQGLSAYISTWGLHRLSGDAKKFLAGTAEDTRYKGKVYSEFLQRLQSSSQQRFDPNQESELINMQLSDYTALNHLAIRLAKEWAFWAPAVLGEAQEP